MNDQLSSGLRTLLKYLGGALVTKGFVDQSGMELLVSAAMTLIGAGWSWWHHRNNPSTPKAQ